jgi:hypothetical protein
MKMAEIRALGLFCESVREESGGTHTIVGILPDNMTLQKVPGALPKLSLYVRILLEPGVDPGPLSIWLSFPNGEKREIQKVDPKLIEATQRTAKDEGAPLVGVIAHAAFPQFPVPGYGRISALLRTTNEEIVCGFLNVKEQPAASGR